MPRVIVIYGEKHQVTQSKQGELLGDVVAATGLPLEQPCAGRGTCGLCKVIDEGGLSSPDEIEKKHLSPGEISVGNRLACRARIQGGSHCDSHSGGDIFQQNLPGQLTIQKREGCPPGIGHRPGHHHGGSIPDDA